MATNTAILTNAPRTEASPKGLHVALWGAQLVLAAMFGMAGVMKATTPITDLAASLPWVTTMPAAVVRFIGIAELAGALGLLLPSLLRIKPQLTVLAAGGLGLVMMLAAAFHLSRGEVAALPINLGLLGLASFVAWGRASRAPIRARRADA